MNDSIRDLFERVKKRAAQAGVKVEGAVKSAGEKTAELVEGAKIKLHIAELQGQCKDIFRDIGALVYAAHKNPNTDTESVEAMLARLDAINEEIKEFRERYNELKQVKRCPKCGLEAGKKDSFCRRCGESL
ncbi:MAG: hypothetical protein LBR85_04855 [Oscillospiraceae bacterium]|jgi:uncharacterized protein (UPF0305 family)|nr:hypothetical protein [Oscillospiraceae bacterium]